MSATCPNCGALAGDWRKIGATLSRDLNTAEDALISQTALIRSQAERIASLEAGLLEIKRMKAEAIGDTGFQTGPAAHFAACQRIARALLSGKDSA